MDRPHSTLYVFELVYDILTICTFNLPQSYMCPLPLPSQFPYLNSGTSRTSRELS